MRAFSPMGVARCYLCGREDVCREPVEGRPNSCADCAVAHLGMSAEHVYREEIELRLKNPAGRL